LFRLACWLWLPWVFLLGREFCCVLVWYHRHSEINWRRWWANEGNSTLRNSISWILHKVLLEWSDQNGWFGFATKDALGKREIYAEILCEDPTDVSHEHVNEIFGFNRSKTFSFTMINITYSRTGPYGINRPVNIIISITVRIHRSQLNLWKSWCRPSMFLHRQRI
jgi:hypothetical protein